MSSFHLAFSNCHFHINLQLIQYLPLLGNFSRQIGAEIVICSRGFFFSSFEEACLFRPAKPTVLGNNDQTL